MKHFCLKYFLYLCVAGNFIMGNPNETFLQPKAHESSLHDKVTSREPRAFILKDMRYKRTSVEVDGVFYKSMDYAGRVIKISGSTIKRRCLSNKFPNYKIVPFRVVYTEKICTKCGALRLLSEFYVQKSHTDGRTSHCKKCTNEYGEEWRADNPERIKNNNKKRRENYPERVKKSEKRWKKNNPGYFKEWEREKRKNDVSYRINKNISTFIWKSLKGQKQGKQWETIIGYTLKEFMAHLEGLFTGGMSWDNYGNGKYEWSLDHIIAVCHWNITSIECQKLKDCWALNNLQPLWHVRNMGKGSKPMHPKYLIKPF